MQAQRLKSEGMIGIERTFRQTNCIKTLSQCRFDDFKALFSLSHSNALEFRRHVLTLSRFFTLNNLFSTEIYSGYMTSAAMANRGSERASERRERKESESCFRGLVMQAKCSWWAGSFHFPGNHLWSLFFPFYDM